jgi:serine phosphatase RsbU (regulator of sigma subunit)
MLYTDGLTEASRDDGEFFGDHQLDLSLRALRNFPVDQFTRATARRRPPLGRRPAPGL